VPEGRQIDGGAAAQGECCEGTCKKAGFKPGESDGPALAAISIRPSPTVRSRGTVCDSTIEKMCRRSGPAVRHIVIELSVETQTRPKYASSLRPYDAERLHRVTAESQVRPAAVAHMQLTFPPVVIPSRKKSKLIGANTSAPCDGRPHRCSHHRFRGSPPSHRPRLPIATNTASMETASPAG
jgi:hypothetical protein